MTVSKDVVVFTLAGLPKRPRVTILCESSRVFDGQDLQNLASNLSMVVHGTSDGTILIQGEPTLVEVVNAFRKPVSFIMTRDRPLPRK